MERIVAGSARQFRFVTTGHTVNTLWLAFYNVRSDNLIVGSYNHQSSADGQYYCTVPVPNSTGIYYAKWTAYYGQDALGAAAPYVTTEMFEVVLEEVSE